MFLNVGCMRNDMRFVNVCVRAYLQVRIYGCVKYKDCARELSPSNVVELYSSYYDVKY